MKIIYNNRRNNNKFNQLPSSLINPIKKTYDKNIDNNISYNNLNIKNQFNQNENIPNEENEENKICKENFPKLSLKVKNKFYNYFNNNDRYNNNIKLKNKKNYINSNNYNRKESEQIKTPKCSKNDGFNGDKFSFEDSISFLKEKRIFSGGKKDRKNINLFSRLHKNNYSRNNIPNVKLKNNNTHSILSNKNIIIPNYNSNYEFKEDYKYYDLSFNNGYKSLEKTNFEHYNDRTTSVKKLTSSNDKIKPDKINYINMNLSENIINNPMIIFNNKKIINNNISIKNSDLGAQKKIKLNYNKNKSLNEKKENNNYNNDIEKNFEILLNNKKKPKNMGNKPFTYKRPIISVNDDYNNQIITEHSEKLENKEEQKDNRNETFINIIYLLDTTYSMEKNSFIIGSIEHVNDSLKKEYKNIQFGFVLYQDFIGNTNILKLGQDHIKVFPPSKEGFIKEIIKFEGGEDYAEDWANAFYEISNLEVNQNHQNIIIHFCDAGAHGNKFSDYDYKNNQEKLLIEALNYCAEKKFKIIGLLYNQFARKSFLACSKLYKGYYNLIDLTCYLEINFLKIIPENIKYALQNKKSLNHFDDDYSQIESFEDSFVWEYEDFPGELIKYKCKMLKLNNIKNKFCINNDYNFVPDLNGSNAKEINELLDSAPTPVYIDEKAYYNNDECKLKTGIKQGKIGDCYLISPLISILYSKIPIVEYIFPEVNYTHNSEKIQMYLYEAGLRKLITFKNTYVTYIEKSEDGNEFNQFLFSSPLNHAFFGMSIEKGYAVSRSDKKNIQSGFKNIIGGYVYNIFNALFGTTSETYTRNVSRVKVESYQFNKSYPKNKNLTRNINPEPVKLPIHHYKNKFHLDISKEELQKKIKKYLDFNGLIAFHIYFNLGGAHAFSLIGYKEKKENEKSDFFVEILNPWYRGNYLENNIKQNNQYDILPDINKWQFDKEEGGNNIYEEEFIEDKILYKIFNNYEKTGFLTLKMDTFYRWVGDICFCDPMLGYLETIIEITKNDDKKNNNIINFEIENLTKFRAFVLESDKKLDDVKEQMEFFQGQINLNSKKYSLYLEKYNYEKDKINYNHYYQKTKNFAFLIYEKLLPGNYRLEIFPEKIEQTLYVKIQANSIIIKDKERDDSLSNHEMYRAGCNCLIYPKYPGCIECNFCQVNFGYMTMKTDKIIPPLIKLVSYYNEVVYNNNYNNKIYNGLLPDYTEYYSCLTYSHLYYHFISTQNGFIALIINKYSFNFECKSRIEYNKFDKQFNAFFEFGSFKITKNLVIYDYDSNFKNLLYTLNYYESTFSLLEVDSFIFKREEKIKFEMQIKSQQMHEIKRLEQIKAQQIYEINNLEQIRFSISSEQQNLGKLLLNKISEQKSLELIKSSLIAENYNLEQLKTSINGERKKLEQLKTSIELEKKSLEQLKLTKVSEQRNLDLIKSSITSKKKSLERLQSTKNSEQRNLDLIKSSITLEEKSLERLQSTKNSEQKNLDQIKTSIRSEKQRLDEIKTSIREEENDLEEIKDKINTKKENLEDIKSSIISEEKKLDNLKLSMKSEQKILEEIRKNIKKEPLHEDRNPKFCHHLLFDEKFKNYRIFPHRKYTLEDEQFFELYVRLFDEYKKKKLYK